MRFLLLLLLSSSLNELKYAVNASKQQMSRHLLLALDSVQAEGGEDTARNENGCLYIIKLIKESIKHK